MLAVANCCLMAILRLEFLAYPAARIFSPAHPPGSFLTNPNGDVLGTGVAR
jgi:hypothetical protein